MGSICFVVGLLRDLSHTWQPNAIDSVEVAAIREHLWTSLNGRFDDIIKGLDGVTALAALLHPTTMIKVLSTNEETGLFTDASLQILTTAKLEARKLLPSSAFSAPALARNPFGGLSKTPYDSEIERFYVTILDEQEKSDTRFKIYFYFFFP